MPAGPGSPTPWTYHLIRLLFQFVLKIFYGTVVVENTDLIPLNGEPIIVCANHSNSLTDALLLITSIPLKKRNLLRLTAKATQFGHRTFTSWLIESAGTVPINRRQDSADGTADNTEIMIKLMEALELGDAVCLFPEGMSRYHPTIAPLKTGVARLVSDVLSRNRDDPNFRISVLPVSITYMHRQHFRSDVLVSFHEPLRFTPKDNPELLKPIDFNEIRSLTSQMHRTLSYGTIDSPSWKLVRTSKLAARIYAPLGTRMSLGDFVRVTRTFIEAFKLADKHTPHNTDGSSTDEPAIGEEAPSSNDVEVAKLCSDLYKYQDELVRLGIKDDRVRRPLSRRIIITRILIRFTWSILLFAISLPGLALWLPVFATTWYAVHNYKKTGPIFDTYDEIAQYKLIYGFASGLCVWGGAVLLTLPFASITGMLVPALMWMSLRWTEDAVSAFRAFVALTRLLRVGKPSLNHMREQRRDLHSRIMNLAVQIGLPDDPETHFVQAGGREKGRVRGRWDSSARYFSVRRRRKRDWNETLRLYDKVDYPEDEM
ncbi:hypothetical protein HGRIS_002502 [Hohenbuehelia grisea]|uniref:Phospholipid/glycerol acyltransferase domain-containing protein n=1 Tax=Hohenbuehelia grisea TaxID=104357 RepID=A0ABR3JKV3_9AGAR